MIQLFQILHRLTWQSVTVELVWNGSKVVYLVQTTIAFSCASKPPGHAAEVYVEHNVRVVEWV